MGKKDANKTTTFTKQKECPPNNNRPSSAPADYQSVPRTSGIRPTPSPQRSYEEPTSKGLKNFYREKASYENSQPTYVSFCTSSQMNVPYQCVRNFNSENVSGIR